MNATRGLHRSHDPARELLRDFPPQHSRVQYFTAIASVHEQAGEYDLALDVILKAIGPDVLSDRLPSLLKASRLHARIGSGSSDAIHLAQQATELADQGSDTEVQSEAWHMLGINLLFASRQASILEGKKEALLDRAAHALEKAGSCSICHPGTRADHALVLALQQRLSEALNMAKSALRSGDDKFVTTWQLLVLLLTADGRDDKAMEMCRLGLESFSARHATPLRILLAHCEVAAGRFHEAVETLKDLLSRAAKGQHQELGGVREADVWLLLAQAYVAAAKLPDAHTCLSKASAIETEPTFWTTRGLVLDASGDKGAAADAFLRAVALGEGETTARVQLGSLLLGEGPGSVCLARLHLGEAVAADPLDHVAWFHLGRCCQQEGDAERAAACFGRSAALGLSVPAVPFSSVLPTLSEPRPVLVNRPRE